MNKYFTEIKLYPEMALLYLSNPKFCTPYEAIESANVIRSTHYKYFKIHSFKKFITAFLAADHIDTYIETLSFEELKRYLDRTYTSEIIQRVIRAKNFPLDVAYKIANFENWYWESIALRKDFLSYINSELSKEEAFSFAKKHKHWKIWSTVLQRIDIDKGELLKKLHQLSDRQIWGDILFLRKDLEVEEAVKIAWEIHTKYKQQHTNTFPNHFPETHIWKKLVKRKDMPAELALQLARQINIPDLYKIILSRKDVRQYLK